MIIEDERDVQGLNQDYLNKEMQGTFIVTASDEIPSHGEAKRTNISRSIDRNVHANLKLDLITHILERMRISSLKY
jgi:hypothetical protein